MLLTLDDIHAARSRIDGRVLRTPLVAMSNSGLAGQQVLCKAESLQPTGSFKVRGATNKIAMMTDDQRARGVVAYSTGNHAQAVARGASMYGVRAVIVMSTDTVQSKVDATKSWGAEVIQTAPNSNARRELAEQLATEQGLMLVPPYDDIEIAAGAGTIGLEILEDCTPAAVLVPIGGGGLISGIAAVIKLSNPSVRVIGVEPELENNAYLSFRSKSLHSLPGNSDSIADAIRVQQVGDVGFEHILAFVDDVVTVSDAQIERAMIASLTGARLVLEAAGAVGVAAALELDLGASSGPLVPIACGANVPLPVLAALLNR